MSRGHYAEAYELLNAAVLPDAHVWERFCAAQQADVGRNRHWEFVAIALLHRFDMADALATQIRDRLVAMQSFWHTRHESMNFRLMRAVAEARLDGRRVTARDLITIGLIPQTDGALPDGPEGISTQYHAYMLLLLLRWGDRQDIELHRIIENAFAWLHSVWRRYGDPCPLGRGRFQLFGYASLAAACALAQDWGLTQPESYIAHVHDRLDPEQPDGALSASWTGPFRDALLHGYNTPEDYRAFAKLWTAGISRSATTIAPASLVRHPLDFSGGCLIADGEGPLAAISAPPLLPPEDKGRKKEFREALRNMLRRPRYAENLLPERLTEAGFRFGRLHFRCDGENLWMEAPPMSVLQSPIIWIKEGVPAPKTEGPLETAAWSWSRPDAPAWRGNSFRIFGEARVRCPLR